MLAPKILLINPPFHRLYKSTYSLNLYPLGLGYLAEAIKKDTDWEVMVYNADFTRNSERRRLVYEIGIGFDEYLENLKNPNAKIWDEVRVVIKEFQPIVLGISSKTQNFRSASIVAKIAKKINKQIVVVIGGPHPSMVGKDVFRCPDIDISVVGEGERTIVHLLKAIARNEKLESVRGIMYRASSAIIQNTPQEYIQNLDTLRFPYENAPDILKDYSLYPKEAFNSIFSTRGCPYSCFFCGSREIWSKKVRFRSPDNVAQEIKQSQKKGLKAISFQDDYFGVTKKYIFELCNTIMQQCPGIKWSCEIHVKSVDDETIAIMKKSGCYAIHLGIESGNNDILKKIRKNITIEEALSACKTIKKHNIELHVFYMIGFPQETEQTLMDTLEKMKRTKCDTLIYSIFTPYPGTEAFDLCKQQGTITDDYDVTLYNHRSPLNYFCPAITKDRFRILAGEIERMIDKKNRLSRVRRMFSLNVIWRVKEKGIWGSICEGARILMGR
ncbi:MAG: radical SAM protein [Candidatus Omnitrophica bacterium]|nr:radical SAM protein [Candidatus Omnitrophota bacterium]MDD5670185.1 radical SAM protein [Candidatus Omnitrophota bacterium]